MLEIGNELRYDTFDLQLERPPPLVDARLRKPVRERIGADGERRAAARRGGRARGGTRAARRGRALDRDRLLQQLPQPRPRAPREADRRGELPRSCGLRLRRDRTRGPRVRALLDRGGQRLCGADRQVLCSSSSSRSACRSSSCSPTAASPRRAPPASSRSPWSNPGPAAGAMGAAFLARQAGWDDVIAFDMGGTTAKVSLIHGGLPHRSHEIEVARGCSASRRAAACRCACRSIELIEIGAGGGSIACDRRARPAARGAAERRRRAGPCLLRPRRRGARRSPMPT